jgi:hypothetical protein
VAYARIFRSLGFPAKYLSELKVLSSLGVKDALVDDEIEAFTSDLADSVSAHWGYDQYNIERRRYLLSVFTIPDRNRLLHVMASEDLAGFSASQLARSDAVNLSEGSRTTRSFEDAFRAARETGADYFILFRFEESERSFTAYADVYLARTGARVGSFSAFRTGNDRVRDSLSKLCEQIGGLLPPRGTIIARRFDVGLIDLGTFHGIKNGERLVIVRKGKVRLKSDGAGLDYDPGDLLGEFAVTASDEAVSEGSIVRSGYFDFINQGDEVLRAQQKAAPAPAAQANPPALAIGNILSRLFGIGKPAQPAAP